MDQDKNGVAKAMELLELMERDIESQQALLKFEKKSIKGEGQKEAFEREKYEAWCMKQIAMLDTLIMKKEDSKSDHQQMSTHIDEQISKYAKDMETRGLLKKPVVVETESDGKVKLIQSIPNHFDYLLTDKSWLLKLFNTNFALQKDFDSLVDFEDGGRMEGKDFGRAHKCTFKFESGKEKIYVLKCQGDESDFKKFGRFREAIFFNEWMPELRKRVEASGKYKMNVPQTYLHVADPETGRYVILMEYLEDQAEKVEEIWKDDNDSKAQEMSGFSEDTEYDKVLSSMLIAIGQQMANVHGSFWMDRESLAKGKEQLKGAPWFFGEQKELWEAHMQKTRDLINLMNHHWKPEAQKKHALLMQALNASVQAIDWDKQVATLQDESYQWTMVHGETWANNFLWGKKSHEISMIDFDMAGFWNPTIDLMYIILYLPVEKRQKHEKTLYEAYHQRLTEFERVPASYTYERMMTDLKTHGVARATSWYAILFNIDGRSLMDLFGSRLNSFLEDHKIDPSQMQMPAYGYF